MNAAWSTADLSALAGTRELQIAAPRGDGSPGRWTPIWVVVAGGRVFVRTWQRRTTGWYGHAVAAGRAWIRLRGQDVEVAVTPTGERDRDAVDDAYRATYGAGAESMMTAEAAASTLLLTLPFSER